MSMNVMDEELFEKYISELQEHTKPSKNDIRYERYVKYINCFISKFGKEKVYLVGSTSERSKLAFSKNDGDADFLLVSGKLEISAENLVPNIEAPCFVWIRADACSRDISLEVVEDEYISTNALREVRPELFTMLRAIYLHVTATVNKMPETDSERTILSVSSKVGIQTTAYRSLKFEDNIEHLKKYFKKYVNVDEEKKREKLLQDRWKKLKVSESEKRIYRRVYYASRLAIPSNRKKNNGGIAFFVQLIEEILARQSGAIPKASPDERDQISSNEDTNFDQSKPDMEGITCSKEKRFKATYLERNHKDFVPALVIKGELSDMKLWKQRVLGNGWEEHKVNDICNTEIFVVSRVSPKCSESDKDFCLSFNLAERKLMIAMSVVERGVYLILKACLKGIFEGIHKKQNKELKLTTYHIKTLLFWLYEQNKTEETSVQKLTDSALTFLQEKLNMKELPHYFVPNSNLFLDFELSDFQILIECVKEVQSNPLGSLEYYFKLKYVNRGEIWFTKEDMDCFWGMSDDGGRREQRNRLEEAMLEFQRAIDEGRDGNGDLRLQQAILETIELCLRDDGCIDFSQFEAIHLLLTRGDVDITKLKLRVKNENVHEERGVLRRLIDKTCTWFGLQMVWILARLRLLLPMISILLFFGSFNLRIKHLVDKFGGPQAIMHILHGAFCGKRLNFREDVKEQIMETIKRFLNCPDKNEDTTCSELKYKLAGYFLCKKELFDMSEIRRV